MPRKLEKGRLVLATHNPGKVREIAALVAPFGLDVVAAGELGLPEPEETGTTFIANAELKALASARGANLPALADDSGLEVEALGGDPGIRSARWAGPERDFGAAMTEVHEKMLAAGGSDRARFVCALALAWPDGHVEAVEGEVKGRIVWPPRGERGFGYDPIFVADGYEETFSEMTPDAKHAISHRADAFRKLTARCLA